jgi:plasmid stabilization system protein ParE
MQRTFAIIFVAVAVCPRLPRGTLRKSGPSSRRDASPTTADRLIDAIIDRFELLAEQPGMGRLRPEFGADIRSLTVENHVIYYRHDGEILIARVLHGRRDQAAAWSQ